MKTPGSKRRVVVGTVTVAALVAAGLGALFAFTPKPRLPQPAAGRPLLQQDELLFTDQQVGVQFTPPMYWSMQARFTDSPHEHPGERLVVKYKRLIPGYQVGWLKVSVANAPRDEPLAKLLKQRKLPEPDWQVTATVEEGFEVGGRPAAQITFGGPLDPDQQGVKDYTCEVVAVRRGPQVFYISGTFATADAKGKGRIRTALDSLVLDPERFRTER